jgi:hypothetical protein
LDTLTTIYTIIGILLGLGGLSYGASRIFKFINRLSCAVGADKNGRTISERLERIEHQLWPNGGSSMADKVNHLTIESAETISDVRFIKKILVANFHIDSPEEETTTIDIAPKTRKPRAKKVSQ